MRVRSWMTYRLWDPLPNYSPCWGVCNAAAFFFVGMRGVIIHASGGSEGWSACDFVKSCIFMSTEWELYFDWAADWSLNYGTWECALNYGYCYVSVTKWWEQRCAMNMNAFGRMESLFIATIRARGIFSFIQLLEHRMATCRVRRDSSP